MDTLQIFLVNQQINDYLAKFVNEDSPKIKTEYAQHIRDLTTDLCVAMIDGDNYKPRDTKGENDEQVYDAGER